MTLRAANGLQLYINERLHVVRWVVEGMRVMVPVIHDGKEMGLRCLVTVAAGYHARVENKKHDFAHWYHIEDMRIDTTRDVDWDDATGGVPA